jgi:hypothetical protein
MSYDWIFREMSNLINSPSKEQEFDSDCLNLRNPDADKVIDGLFRNTFLPQIEKAFHNSAFEISKGANYPTLENNASIRLTKQFTLVIDDPGRPFEPGELNKTWFARCDLELSKYDYLFSTDLILLLPVDYEITKIILLMKNPYFKGLPPELTMDDECYSIKFHNGRGASWGLRSRDEAATGICEELRKLQRILTFLNENEFELNTEKNYMKLENLLVSYFDNW